MNLKPIPILITWDVDPSPEVPLAARQRSLDVTLDMCRDLAIPTTFFVTANAEQAQPPVLARMQAEGHQIGCHGLTHTDEEEYDRMPAAMQREYIEKATQKLQQGSDTPIRVFRSPRLKTSHTTLSILAEYGYVADSSVCSQRMDLISSNLINRDWLFAPRCPYHPHHENAFKKGDLPLWEVPVSAVAIPFISAFLSVFGLTFMKGVFRLLYAEAQRTGKPIVYLAHPIEFTAKWMQPLTLKTLSPAYIRTHGLIIRKKLYRLQNDAWLEATRQLFAYMAARPGVQFMTVGAYAESQVERSVS
ncbi:MAG: polysaccharide deacetylase family protein [Anaerolineae bacterium]|nr:polysaccharide deacetylase family protein [Anaerolineae bacterium]